MRYFILLTYYFMFYNAFLSVLKVFKDFNVFKVLEGLMLSAEQKNGGCVIALFESVGCIAR